MAVFGPNEKNIPGMTLDIFKEFLEKALTYVNSDHGNVVKDIFKKPEFFGYTFLGLTDMECEVTDDGKIVTHWTTSGKAKMKYSVALADFDDIMIGKTAPMTAMMLKKLKVDGPMVEAMKFINFMPSLKIAYNKARKEIGDKYSISHFTSK
jgi:putative sterol carrier protein